MNLPHPRSDMTCYAVLFFRAFYLYGFIFPLDLVAFLQSHTTLGRLEFVLNSHEILVLFLNGDNVTVTFTAIVESNGSDTVLNCKPIRQIICVEWLTGSNYAVDQARELVRHGADYVRACCVRCVRLRLRIRSPKHRKPRVRSRGSRLTNIHGLGCN